MPSRDVLGAHFVLRQSNPGRTHRLSELIAEAHADELAVRREIDKLALEGQVKRLYVGEHVMVRKTDEFDPDAPVDVDGLGDSQGSVTVLDPSTYELPDPRVLDPAEGYTPPEKGDLIAVDVVESGKHDGT